LSDPLTTESDRVAQYIQRVEVVLDRGAGSGSDYICAMGTVQRDVYLPDLLWDAERAQCLPDLFLRDSTLWRRVVDWLHDTWLEASGDARKSGDTSASVEALLYRMDAETAKESGLYRLVNLIASSGDDTSAGRLAFPIFGNFSDATVKQQAAERYLARCSDGYPLDHAVTLLLSRHGGTSWPRALAPLLRARLDDRTIERLAIEHLDDAGTRNFFEVIENFEALTDGGISQAGRTYLDQLRAGAAVWDARRSALAMLEGSG
jgi:hypothetical protein